MRKFLKNSLLEIFGTIFEAHSSVRELVKKSEYEKAVSVLGDCQDTAVQIGGFIEESEGEDCPVISLLLKYCEELYHVSESLAEVSSVKQMKKGLDKALFAAQKSFEENVKVKLEVVFLPYKASMWDSLESIWKAADADPDCDAYVVPIPYYDRNPDHSFGEFHYEGNEYPDYVPVMHYNNYDIETRKPDVIYIHNPYDDCNYVTSVDPYYYSKHLKQYTNCLVYVPYDTTMGYNRPNCPAYYNVVQGPEYRKYYDMSLDDNKFIPTGSPKFDRIINLCNNPERLPVKWYTKIMDRKVYLYNTSIEGALNNTENLLKKIEYVFSCFDKHRNACLVWRPHPLLDNTFKTMCPIYAERYRKLKEFFIEHDIGIYDDTPDVTITIVNSDFYIGDSGSSLITLFGIAGKPIFILNNSLNFDNSVENEDNEYNSKFGFTKISKTYRYACMENSTNTLDNFIKGNILGEKFSKKEQLANYKDIAVNLDGTCGEKTHLILKKII